MSTEIVPVPDGANDDAVGATGGESYVEFCVEEGVTYYIQVDGNAVDEEGFFDITVTDVTGILDCSCPIDLILTVQYQGNTGSISPFYYNTAYVEIIGGTAPYEYAWSTSGYVRNAIISLEEVKVTYADNAMWTVTITDANGCSIVGTNDPADGMGGLQEILDIDEHTITNDICNSNNIEGEVTVDVEFGTAPYTYEWVGPITWDGTGQGTATVSNAPSGWYQVIVTDSGDPTGPFDADGNPVIDTDPTTPLPLQITEGWYWVTCEQLSGRGKWDGQTGIEVYPNPVSTTATISFGSTTDEQLTVNLYDLNGKLQVVVFEGTIKAGTQNEIQFETGPLTNGLYLLEMKTNSGVQIYEKLLISK